MLRPSPDDLTLWPEGMSGGFGCPDSFVQRPLALRLVMLSSQIIAYYGLIRATCLHAERLIFFVRPALGRRVGPQFKLHLFSYMPSPVPRRTDWLLLTVTWPITLVFAMSTLARRPQPTHVGSRVDGVTRLI